MARKPRDIHTAEQARRQAAGNIRHARRRVREGIADPSVVKETQRAAHASLEHYGHEKAGRKRAPAGPRSLSDIQAELDLRRNEYKTGKITRKQFQLYERDLATEGSYHARTRKGRKTAHVPAGHANGGQFTGPGGNPPRALTQHEINQMTREARNSTKLAREKRQGKPSGSTAQPKPRQARKREPSEKLVAIRHTGGRIDPYAPPDPDTLAYVYGKENVGRALNTYTMDLLKEAADKVQAKHPGTKPESKAKKQALIAYIVKYHDAPSEPPPAKPAPKPRKRKASAPTKRTRFDIWRERNPGRPKSEYVPRQGNRTRRTKAQATVEYLDARGQRNRRAREGYQPPSQAWLNTKVKYGGKVMRRHEVVANLRFMGYDTDKAIIYMKTHGLA